MMKHFIKSTLNRLGFELVNKSKVPALDFETDRRFQDLYELAQEKCRMGETDNPWRRQRHYTLNYLLWNTPLDQGAVCELGCFRGLSAYQIAHHIRSVKKNIPFHIFDSFAGLSPYERVDTPRGPKEDELSRRKQFACDLKNVQENLKDFPFIEYHPGWIPARFGEVKSAQFSFVHVDVDLYQPIKDSFLFFYPRMLPGGIMVFDDYGYAQFPGAKKAVDECLQVFKDPFFVPLPSGQAFLIKDLSRATSGRVDTGNSDLGLSRVY